MADLIELLSFGVKNKASDLHLSAGMPPLIRVHGEVKKINMPSLSRDEVTHMITDIMNESQKKFFDEHYECDFSFEVKDVARFRVNAFQQNRGPGAVLRTIPSNVLTLEQLNAVK